MMKHIGIIGIGKIGAHIADRLLYEKNISRISLISRSKDKLSGRIESLRMQAYFINSKVKIDYLDYSEIDKIDLIIIAVKDNYDPRNLMKYEEFPNWLSKNLRYIGILHDLPILKLISHKLQSYSGKIAILTNPVEICTYFMSKWIPNAKIFGIGASLDIARMIYFLKDKNQNLKNENVLVAGEHGFDIMALRNTKLNKNIVITENEDLNFAIEKSIKSGFDIVTNLGFTLHDCIPIFIEDICYLLKSPNYFRCFAFKSNNCCVSEPLNLSLNKINSFDYTQQELDKKLRIEERLCEIINQIESNLEF